MSTLSHLNVMLIFLCLFIEEVEIGIGLLRNNQIIFAYLHKSSTQYVIYHSANLFDCNKLESNEKLKFLLYICSFPHTSS